ncbi:MAG: hypothetical protein M3Y82_04280, partial [Verrucomicrobiota bacterium]|nr:hypothetical protein [Verrucomicrobiota bacterium]
LGAHEETDLNIRLHDAGFEAWWLPGAAINHFISRERMTFSVLCRTKFEGGSSSAILRFNSILSNFSRIFFRIKRLLIGPLQILFSLLAALITFLFGRRSRAIHFLFQAARTAGFSWQLLQPGK